MEQTQVFRVVIAHAHAAQRRHIAAELNQSGRFRVVGDTSNGAECVELVKKYQPDLLIADAVLTGMDGVSVLRWLRASQLATRSLILTNYGGPVVDQVAALGADYCLLAPYDCKSVADWAAMLLLPPQNIPVSYSNCEIDQMSRRVLCALGGAPKLRGFHDAVAGVRLLIRDPEQIHYVTGQLYPAIGACRNASWKSVEHTLRTLIDSIWTYSNLDALQQHFNLYIDRGSVRPTGAEFLSLLAELVSEELRKSAEAQRQARAAQRI